MPQVRFGLNPLPWLFDGTSFDLSVSGLRTAFRDIQQTPFRGVHADVPPDLDVSEYRNLLAEYGLEPAPGYFAALFADVETTEVVEQAKQHAARQAQLGNTVVFLADSRAPVRRETPAVGAGGETGRLQQVVDVIGAVSAAITAEGVRPAFHQHVGTWIETEAEIDAVLAGVPEAVLGFGPDTGHLAWAGIDPAAIIARYADRVSAVHLKDVSHDQIEGARRAGADYAGSTRGPWQVWREPGSGDVDLAAALAALPAAFAGWTIVEVDVPSVATTLESTAISARWVTEHRGDGRF